MAWQEGSSARDTRARRGSGLPRTDKRLATSEPPAGPWEGGLGLSSASATLFIGKQPAQYETKDLSLGRFCRFTVLCPSSSFPRLTGAERPRRPSLPERQEGISRWTEEDGSGFDEQSGLALTAPPLRRSVL